MYRPLTQPWTLPPADAVSLLSQGKLAEAMPVLERLAAQEPANPRHRMHLAWCAGELGDTDRAISLYGQMIDEISQEPNFLMHFATILKYAGRRQESIAILRSCTTHVPSLGTAWWSLANVKTERFSAADIASMRAQLAGTALDAQDRIPIHYALGLALEQAGEYAQSFAHYAQGAAAKRATIKYDGRDLGPMMARSRAFFTASRMADHAGAGCMDASPIFIVGLPRAGSTLIEQILASHSQVEGTRELPEISNIVRDIGHGGDTTRPFRYPECLAELGAAELSALGARYIERTRAYRHTDKPYFIDKMPANWQHAGLIRMILPHARIIDARRGGMATCFSAFKQLFGHGVHYSYDLAELGQYWRAYADRMADYDAQLPGYIHRVVYEDLVADTEAQTRALLAYCGLDFEAGCLRFWESARVVATPSSEQVRRPVFTDGVEQWRHYAPWLGALEKEGVLS